MINDDNPKSPVLGSITRREDRTACACEALVLLEMVAVRVPVGHPIYEECIDLALEIGADITMDQYRTVVMLARR